MQPRQPGAGLPQDPLVFGYSSEPVPPVRPSTRSSSGPGATTGYPGETVRLLPEIRMYHRLLRGKLHPLTVELRRERDLGRGTGGDSNPLAGGPVVSIQPVIPGAVVSPASIDVPAATGGEAKFWVTPVGRRGRKLPESRIEFRSGGRLLEAVRAPTRIVTRRLAWFFLFLAIGIPMLFAWIRAHPVQEFGPSPRVLADQTNERPAAPAAPAVPPPNNTDQKNDRRGGEGDKKLEAPSGPDRTGALRAGASGAGAEAEKKATLTGAEPKPTGTTAQPGGTTTPRPTRPPRQGGGAAGGVMAAQAPPEIEAAARTPLEPRDSLDRYLTTRVFRYVIPKPGETPGFTLTAKSTRLVKWPDDARGFFYLGLFYIKDGYSLSEEKNLPGLLDVYEFIMANSWAPYQDFLIGGILLFISILLWFMQSAASRRIKAGALEIVPA